MSLPLVLKHALERVVLLPVRMRHRRSAKAKQRVRLDALATVRRTLGQADQLNAIGLRTVFNVGLYLLLLDDDLAQFTDDLVCAIGDRRRAFVAKHEAILLYEAGEDLPQLLGHDFRQAVTDLGASPEQFQRLNAASSDLNEFWREERQFLGEIRNALSAHREHDALAYVTALEQLKPLDVMRRAADLSGRMERLVNVLADIALLGH